MQKNDFVNVKVSKDDLLEMLLERWKLLSHDDDVRLISEYYQDLIDNGIFEGVEVDICNIVDNDYFNNLALYEPDEIDRMLEECCCESIDELVESRFVFTCEYGYVVGR